MNRTAIYPVARGLRSYSIQVATKKKEGRRKKKEKKKRKKKRKEKNKKARNKTGGGKKGKMTTSFGEYYFVQPIKPE